MDEIHDRSWYCILAPLPTRYTSSICKMHWFNTHVYDEPSGVSVLNAEKDSIEQRNENQQVNQGMSQVFHGNRLCQ